MPNVKIRIERGEEGGKDLSAAKGAGVASKKEISVQTLFATKMMGTAKQIVTNAASNVGNFTGDYIKQDQINVALEVVSGVVTIAMGAMAGCVPGAAIAAAGLLVNKAIQQFNTTMTENLAEKDRNIILARSGNAAINGSRGTEN